MKDVMIDEINGRKTMDAQDQVQSMGESKTEAEVVITETEKTLNNLETRADDWSNSTQF